MKIKELLEAKSFILSHEYGPAEKFVKDSFDTWYFYKQYSSYFEFEDNVCRETVLRHINKISVGKIYVETKIEEDKE